MRFNRYAQGEGLMKMQQTHINSFFKRKETSATSEIQSITISTNNVNNDDVNNDSEQKKKL